jgi:ABC-type proline/glycine betaine transport system permease subunit
MQLLVAHQILIASAIGLATIFGLRSAVLFGRSGGAADLVLALVSAAFAAGLVLYFRTLRAKWRAMKRP